MLILCISCGKSPEYPQIDLQNSSALNFSEQFVCFSDKHLVSIWVQDSLAFVKCVQSDTCIVAVNLNTKKVISFFGTKGRGPNDVYGPEFINMVGDSDILLEDVNTKKMLKLATDKNSGTFSLEKYMDYPLKIFPSCETNFSPNFIVGRKTDAYDKMFYIYDKTANVITNIEPYPVINHLKVKYDLNYVYAPVLALNEKKNRIIVGMYFFDMFHLYDLIGERIKTFCFSDNHTPLFGSGNIWTDLEGGYSGIGKVFPTDEHCYLLRLTKDSKNEIKTMLIQINWDGELVKSYKIPDDGIYGQFYVDEAAKKIYAIRHFIDQDEMEIFSIVSYLIN
jgi:hypothetical protein